MNLLSESIDSVSDSRQNSRESLDQDEIEKKSIIFLNFCDVDVTTLSPTDEKFIRILPHDNSLKKITVQLNDMVFEGEFMFGTNILFNNDDLEKCLSMEADEFFGNNVDNYDVFYVCDKTYYCKLIKIRDTGDDSTENGDTITKFKFKLDYSEALKKFANYDLNQDDMAVQIRVKNNSYNNETTDFTKSTGNQVNNLKEIEQKEAEEKRQKEAEENLLLAYERLKLLARIPLRRIPEEI